MQFFLKKINEKFEYKQYLPNKTVKRKGDSKIIDKDISGLTGEKLLEKYTIFLRNIRMRLIIAKPCLLKMT